MAEFQSFAEPYQAISFDELNPWPHHRDIRAFWLIRPSDVMKLHVPSDLRFEFGKDVNAIDSDVTVLTRATAPRLPT